MPPERRPPPPKRPRSVLSLLVSALIAGTIVSLVVESGVGLVGGWNIPQHSAQVLGETNKNNQLLNPDFVPGVLRSIRTNLKWAAVISFKTKSDNPFVALGARHLEALLNRLQITTLRLASIAAYAPAMLLILTATVVDAAVERRLRAQAGGKESGYLYHRLQRLRGMALVAPIFLFLAWPWHIPAQLGALAAFPAAIFIWLQLVLFKRVL